MIAKHGESNYTVLPYPDASIVSSIPSGLYSLEQPAMAPSYLRGRKPHSDATVQVTCSDFDAVRNAFASHFDDELRRSVQATGRAHKNGILLYGPPGCGKTHLVWDLVMQYAKSHNAVVFSDVDPDDDVDEAIKLARHNSEDRPIIVVYDEFERVSRNYETYLLQFLDGERSKDNVLVVAMTNYIDRIPERVYDRPSRFSSVFKIGMPDWHARKTFCRGLFPKAPQNELDFVVNLTEGLSLDHVKQYATMRVLDNRPRTALLDSLRNTLNTRKEALTMNDITVEDQLAQVDRIFARVATLDTD